MSPSTPTTKDNKKREEPKATLPVGHPKAGYVRPDLSTHDPNGICLPRSRSGTTLVTTPTTRGRGSRAGRGQGRQGGAEGREEEGRAAREGTEGSRGGTADRAVEATPKGASS
jgi:hypothetical protein